MKSDRKRAETHAVVEDKSVGDLEHDVAATFLCKICFGAFWIEIWKLILIKIKY